MKVLIIGCGKLGYRLASTLIDEKCDITVIDSDEKVIDDVNNSLDVLSINANGLDFQVLKEIEIGSYDLVLATTTNDEANVLISSVAKKLGCNKTIARVRNSEYYNQVNFITDELGIDYIINPDKATANSIAKYLLKKYLLMSDDFADGKVKLVDFNIESDEKFVGRKLHELEGFEKLLITVILRQGKTIIPNGETVLKEGDVILISGASSDIEDFDKKHSHINKARSVKKVMILGGGKLGLNLGYILSKEKIETTIIEQDEERCLELKEKLPNCVIINGDGTNFSLLNEEMIDSFDAFVAATGIDETNLLMALSVKQGGVYKSVAKISRPNYNRILDRIGIDGAFNAAFITANEILKFVRGRGSLRVNLMLDGEAEFTELLLEENVKVLNKPIKNLNLPNGILIAALVRDGEVEIPNGDTILNESDRIIVFCRHDQLDVLKEYFYKSEKRGGILSELRNRF